MNTFRVARAALRARPAAFRVPLQRRTYADAAPDKIKLSLALPHQAIYKSQDVVQVNIPAESGEMGVLANHVPSIEQLKPGLIEVIEDGGSSKQFFLSGGFAVVQPNSVMSINAIEGYAVEDFSADAVRSQISEAQKIANGSGSEQDIAEAKIELEISLLPGPSNSFRGLVPLYRAVLYLGLGPRQSLTVAMAPFIGPSPASWDDDEFVFLEIDGSGREPSPSEVIPSGMVTCRIRQLHGTLPRGRRPSTNPLREWDCENVWIGWGRRSASNFEDSDIHGYSEEFHHDHGHDPYASECEACKPPPSSHKPEPTASVEQIRRHRASVSSNEAVQADDNRTKGTYAGDLYQQYRISQPIGWLSDEQDPDLAHSGDGNHSPQICCHVCHVCSHRTLAPAQCAACGHQFCRRCACERLEEIAKIHRTPADHSSSVYKEETRANNSSSVDLEHGQQQESSTTRTTTKRYASQQTKTGGGVEIHSETKHEEHEVVNPGLSSPRSRKPMLDEPSATAFQEYESGQQEHFTDTQAAFHSSTNKMRRHRTGALDENPFLVADRSIIAKNTTSQKTRHTALNKEERGCADAVDHATHMEHHPAYHTLTSERYRSKNGGEPIGGPSAKYDSVRRVSQVTSPGMDLQEHSSSHMADVHAEHEDIHRHHSFGFHGTPHIAEHLAAATGSDYAKLQDQAAGRSRSRVQERPNSRIAKYLKPMTPVHPIAEVTSRGYLEELISPGHPAHKKQKEIVTAAYGQVPDLVSSLSTSRQESRKLTHVESVRQAGRRDEANQRTPLNEGFEKANEAASSKISSWQQRIEEDVEHKARVGKTNQPDAIKHTVPQARVSSPPVWLKNPQKEAAQGWFHQNLRHVSSQDPHDSWRSHQSEEAPQLPPRPNSSIHEGRQSSRLQSSRPIAEGIRQLHQLQSSSDVNHKTGTEEWAEHLGIRPNLYSSQTQRIYNEHGVKRAPRTPRRPSPLAAANAWFDKQQYKDSSHGHVVNTGSTPVPPHIRTVDEQGVQVEHVTTTSIDAAEEYLEEFHRQSQHLQERYRRATIKAEAELNRLRVERSKARREPSEQTSSSRITASGSSTPSQVPPALFRRKQQDAMSESQVSRSNRKEAITFVDKPSDLDLHRPSAIAPPNHECSWKDRYVALTSEIRQLKAEMSSVNHTDTLQHELEHGDTLGIEGLTIVMHLKDKDDLVINTDLLREGEE
ncbi:ATP synthase delta mitochondrial [Seiridium cupressi]